MTLKDELFKSPESGTKPFQFDARVAAVFDNMVQRSIPFYTEIQSAICSLSIRFAQAQTTVYDLGCSTGTTSLLLRNSLPKSVHIVGIDASQDMIQSAQKKEKEVDILGVDWQVQTLGEPYLWKPASVIILNLVLQFVPPSQRTQVVRDLVSSLVPGGVLILVEKVTQESEILDTHFKATHHQFKHHNGCYNWTEIAGKQRSLEGVLTPWTLDNCTDALRQEGLDVDTFFGWFNFSGLIGLKSRCEVSPSGG